MTDKCLLYYCQFLPTFERNKSFQPGLSEHCPALPHSQASLVCLASQGQSINNMKQSVLSFCDRVYKFFTNIYI